MSSKHRLGELLIEQSLITKDVLEQALRTQVGGNRRLGHILVRMGAISDDQLAEAIASQLAIPISTVADRFSPDVRKTLPRYLCSRYGVIPLALKDNNILELAMANPADSEARNDLEDFTGMVIEPVLARQTDIEREIPKRIPLQLGDIFSPQANNVLTKSLAVVALICAIGLGIYTYDYIKVTRYGTVSTSGDFVLYQHHDLTIAVNKSGAYSLQGRGAYADGLYRISFPNEENLRKFIGQHANDFSEQQKVWLQRTIDLAGSEKTKRLFAQK